MARELTIAELTFCERIIAGDDQETAFEAAFGYSQRTRGYGNADRVAKKPAVQAKLLEWRLGIEKKSKITREACVEEIAAVAFSNVTDYLEWDDEGSVRLKASGELTKRQASAVKAVTVDRDGRARLEFHDKLAAQKQLAQLMGWLAQDVNLTQNNFVIQAPNVLEDEADFEKKIQGYLDVEALPPPAEEK